MEWEHSSLRMRRVLVLLTIAVLAAGAAEATYGAVPLLLRTPGAELIELRGGKGRAAVTKRGSLLVNIGSGRLRIVDLVGQGRPNLSDRCQSRARRVSPRTVQIRGRNIGCFISSDENGGPWQVIMRGRRISASGVVKGSLTLDGADRGDPGQYRIAGGEWRRWPRTAQTFGLDRN